MVLMISLWLWGTVFSAAQSEFDLEPIQLWPPAGIYTNYIGLVFDSSDKHTRYTLDGTEPTPSSIAASTPFLITATTTVKAQRFKDGEAVSACLTHVYEIVRTDISEFRSSLPIVFINTLGKPIPIEGRISTQLTVIDSPNDHSAFRSSAQYSGWAAVGIRGSSSRFRPKVPYRIELQEDAGTDRKTPLLGMPAEADWILLALDTDRTLVREAWAHGLWRQMGHYSPQCRFVELFVIRTNRATATIEMADYEGVYLLIEKIKRGKGRLNIKKLKPGDLEEPEITGGYIFKKDRLNVGEEGFRSQLGIPFVFEEPKEAELVPAQKLWLSNHVHRFEQALFSANFTNPTNGYRAYLDVGTFIDYHWMVELTLNADGYGYSVFLHKERGGKLKMGPIWDWDLGFANSTFEGAIRVEGWQWSRFKYPLYKWYERLFEDPDFLQAYIDRWSELRTNLFATTNLLAAIELYAANLGPAVDRNFQRWPSLSPTVHPNYRIGTNYQSHLTWVKKWLARRVEWIDSQGFPPPTVKVTASDTPGAVVISLESTASDAYYTTNGADPRSRGGGVAESAKKAEGPMTMGLNERLLVRARSPFKLWSAPIVVDAASLSEKAATTPR